ncbi:MAG: hypothetical protein HY433_01145 [Candidatus Liptonbacteria bacterium]|nr:hypothetical protein [Candidatus Liptonbacteria bacterium]
MIYDDIKNSSKQFTWEPKIENASALKKFKKFIVVGMGGSHFPADIIKTWRPDFQVISWSNYGLPPLPPKELKEHLIIASSYSGNTEETIDGFELALKKKLNVAVMASGGKLVAMAEILKLPYAKVPSGVQPRSALGYMLKATLALMGERQALTDLSKLTKTFRSKSYEKKGKELARKLKGSVPAIYASPRNYSIVYNWKIRFNETGKIPAFYNLIPEMNHNEMSGFDATRSAAPLSRHFYFIFLKDKDDHPQIIKRMDVMRRIFTNRGFRSEVILLGGKNCWEKIFSSIMLADWTSYYTGKQYHAEPEAVKMIEEFKRLVAKR